MYEKDRDPSKDKNGKFTKKFFKDNYTICIADDILKYKSYIEYLKFGSPFKDKADFRKKLAAAFEYEENQIALELCEITRDTLFIYLNDNLRLELASDIDNQTIQTSLIFPYIMEFDVINIDGVKALVCNPNLGEKQTAKLIETLRLSLLLFKKGYKKTDINTLIKQVWSDPKANFSILFNLRLLRNKQLNLLSLPCFQDEKFIKTLHEHPNITPELLDNLCDQIQETKSNLKHQQENTDITPQELEILAKQTDDIKVLEFVALHPKTSAQTLYKIATFVPFDIDKTLPLDTIVSIINHKNSDQKTLEFLYLNNIAFLDDLNLFFLQNKNTPKRVIDIIISSLTSESSDELKIAAVLCSKVNTEMRLKYLDELFDKLDPHKSDSVHNFRKINLIIQGLANDINTPFELIIKSFEFLQKVTTTYPGPKFEIEIDILRWYRILGESPDFIIDSSGQIYSLQADKVIFDIKSKASDVDKITVCQKIYKVHTDKFLEEDFANEFNNFSQEKKAKFIELRLHLLSAIPTFFAKINLNDELLELIQKNIESDKCEIRSRILIKKAIVDNPTLKNTNPIISASFVEDFYTYIQKYEKYCSDIEKDLVLSIAKSPCCTDNLFRKLESIFTKYNDLPHFHFDAETNKELALSLLNNPCLPSATISDLFQKIDWKPNKFVRFLNYNLPDAKKKITLDDKKSDQNIAVTDLLKLIDAHPKTSSVIRSQIFQTSSKELKQEILKRETEKDFSYGSNNTPWNIIEAILKNPTLADLYKYRRKKAFLNNPSNRPIFERFGAIDLEYNDLIGVEALIEPLYEVVKYIDGAYGKDADQSRKLAIWNPEAQEREVASALLSYNYPKSIPCTIAKIQQYLLKKSWINPKDVFSKEDLRLLESLTDIIINFDHYGEPKQYFMDFACVYNCGNDGFDGYVKELELINEYQLPFKIMTQLDEFGKRTVIKNHFFKKTNLQFCLEFSDPEPNYNAIKVFEDILTRFRDALDSLLSKFKKEAEIEIEKYQTRVDKLSAKEILLELEEEQKHQFDLSKQLEKTENDEYQRILDEYEETSQNLAELQRRILEKLANPSVLVFEERLGVLEDQELKLTEDLTTDIDKLKRFDVQLEKSQFNAKFLDKTLDSLAARIFKEAKRSNLEAQKVESYLRKIATCLDLKKKTKENKERYIIKVLKTYFQENIVLNNEISKQEKDESSKSYRTLIKLKGVLSQLCSTFNSESDLYLNNFHITEKSFSGGLISCEYLKSNDIIESKTTNVNGFNTFLKTLKYTYDEFLMQKDVPENVRLSILENKQRLCELIESLDVLYKS